MYEESVKYSKPSQAYVDEQTIRAVNVNKASRKQASL